MFQFGPDFLSALQSNVIAVVVAVGITTVILWKTMVPVNELITEHKQAMGWLKLLFEGTTVFDPKDPEKPRIIHRGEVVDGVALVGVKLDSIQGQINLHCLHDNCPFHTEMLASKLLILQEQKNAVAAVELFTAEGRVYRETIETHVRDLREENHRTNDALLGFLGKLVEQLRSQNGKKTD
ncbi:MAG: hypothetical protein WC654_00745 [Patescibacteria group bacterium]